jgi:hypothetical protein
LASKQDLTHRAIELAERINEYRDGSRATTREWILESVVNAILKGSFRTKGNA